MSLQTELSDFFQEHLSVDEIRHLVVRLRHGDALARQLPSRDVSLARFCEDVSDVLCRHRELDDAFFSGLRDRLPNLVPEIDRLAALAAALAPDARSTWREIVARRLDGRLVLRDVDGAGHALEPVYVDLELLLQRPVGPRVLRADEGRCEQPRNAEPGGENAPEEHAHALDPDERPLDLAAWLTTSSDEAHTLMIVGEVGAGKTELLARAARSLAQDGTADALLPLWVDAKPLASEGLMRAVADWSGWTEPACREFLLRPDLGFAVFVDSLDEGGASIPETVAMIRGTLGPRLRRLVLATRSAQRRAVRDVQVARVSPWRGHSIDRFLDRWARTDPESAERVRRERRLGVLEDILATPLTATFCVLVAREEPDALRNRTRLFHAIVARIVSHWRKLRTPTERLYRRWDALMGMLGRLALERLRDHPSGLTIGVLRERLQEDSLDGVDDLLEDLTSSYGVLIRTPHGYDFSLRWFAEYLAGRFLRDRPADLDAAVDRSWAFEPVRHAITGAPSADIPALIDALIADEDADEVRDAPARLRRAQLAAVVAADLREDLSQTAMDRLVPAIWRRLTDEGSAWITAEMARATRGLARVGGPVWGQLKCLLLAALFDPRANVAGWYARQAITEPAYWLRLLRHRDAKVRVLAIERLRPAIDDAAVRTVLWQMLFDEKDDDPPALAAGSALRGAARDESFSAMLPGLLRLLCDGSQLQIGAAALALRPDEADLDQLALGLFGAHNAGGHVRHAVRDLADAPGGAAALDRSLWRDWRSAEHAFASPEPEPEPEGTDPPLTGYVRWDLLRAVAPALHRLPATTMLDLVHAHDYSHSLSHELEQIDASILPTVIDAMCDHFICLEKIESVVRLARQYPEIGHTLVARWRRIVDSGANRNACVRFPGQALAALVEQGCDEAVDALVEWLPRSRLGQPGWANEGTPLAAAVFTHERVLAAGRQCLRGGHDPTLLRRLAPAWHGLPEVWDRLAAMLRNDRLSATQAWRIVAEACTHATLPEPFAATAAHLADVFIAQHGVPTQHGDDWHSAAPTVLQFVETHGLASRLRHALRRLAGLQDDPPCPRIQPMAVALMISTVEPDEQVRLAEAMMHRYVEEPALLDRLTPAALAALLRPASQLWKERLLASWQTLDAASLVLGAGKRFLRLLNALPARERGDVARCLLERREPPGLPWIQPLDNPSGRYYRPSDLLWQIAFEAGAV